MSRDKYLVEQVHEVFNGQLVVAPTPIVVEAESPQHALKQVQSFYSNDDWYFAPNELEETVQDYLWEAADGSMVMIAVRRLP